MIGERQTPIEARLRPALSESAVAQVWSGIQRGRAGQRRATDRRLATAGRVALAAAVVLGVVVFRPETTPGALRSTGADLITVGAPLRGEGAQLALDDGSRVTLDHAAELEVLANDGQRFVTLLRHGRGRFEVQPGGSRRWIIETDLATVEVVGTELTVERTEMGLVVAVDHGVVLVRGERVPGRVRRLRAGERLEVPDPEIAPAAPVPHSPAPPPQPAPAPAPSPEPRTPSESAPRPRPRAIDLDARMGEADQARAEGRPEEAARILERAVREGGRDPRASLASFSLGRLQLEVLGRPEAAADSFARVVEHGSPRGLVEDAQVRRVEALVRAGRTEDARRQARAYEARWPGGRRLAEVRALMGE